MTLHFENARLIDPEAGTDTLGSLTVADGLITARNATARRFTGRRRMPNGKASAAAKTITANSVRRAWNCHRPMSSAITRT